DSLTGCWYDCSAHLLWVGDRTRQLDGAHLEFLRGIGNPVAAKLGPTATPEDTVALCGLLDPGRVPGRLTLVARMGASRVEQLLPPLVRAVRDAGHTVVWACDPMHGNTFVGPSGHKTRRFDDVMAELAGFFAVHRSDGTHPGGIHVELTGEDVTECPWRPPRRHPGGEAAGARPRGPGRPRRDRRRPSPPPLRDGLRPPPQRQPGPGA